MVNHFGISIMEKKSNRINKELYLSSKPEGMKGWTENDFFNQRIKADINYDANMKFYNSLNSVEFNKVLNKMVKKFRLKQCTDLKKLEGVGGLYVMVMDSYKQIYVGITDDIKKRIHYGHWNKTKSLERLIFGDLFTSKISIDSFGALDTTRIFYYSGNKDLSILEKDIVNYIGPDYLINRTGGGLGFPSTYTDDKQSTLLAVVANKKKRNLIPFTEINRLVELPRTTIQNYLLLYPELEQYLIINGLDD